MSWRLRNKQHKQPELFPGAEAEKDCQPVAVPAELDGGEGDEEETHEITWDELPETAVTPARYPWYNSPPRWAQWLERPFLIIEKLVNRLTGTPQLNPFYHTGTMAVFLLIIVGITGFYLFLFFQYGFTASYQAVNRMEGLFIARTMRAIHRYASGALVITTLLHAFRMLFMVRFRGARWLAWITGVVMTVILWVAGVTGYWLIWDQRAQLITTSFVRALGQTSTLAASFMAWLVRAESGRSWPILLTLLGIHVLLFLTTAVFFWLHIRRLSRPRWLPDFPWVAGMGTVLLLGGLLFPAGLLPAADLTHWPQTISIDPVFLFFLPLVGKQTAVFMWGGLLLITAVSLSLPWLLPDKSTQSVHIIKDRCTGCTKCALDCPYQAINMVERQDGKPHKYIAIENPALCVSCGICIGSCDGVAVTLGNTPPEQLWDVVAARLTWAKAFYPGTPIRLVFTCHRHAAHGAQKYLTDLTPGRTPTGESLVVVPLPCVGTLPPDLLPRALEMGVTNIQVIGCPPDDCVNREGNLWTAQRLTRQRVPRLKRPFAEAPITTAWVAPNEFDEALTRPLPEYGHRLAQRGITHALHWRQFVPAFMLLALVMLTQIWLTDIEFRPFPERPSTIEVVLTDVAEPLAHSQTIANMLIQPELVLWLNGHPYWQHPLKKAQLGNSDAIPVYNTLSVSPGQYHIQLQMQDRATGVTYVLFDDVVSVAAGEIARITYENGRFPPCRGNNCPE